MSNSILVTGACGQVGCELVMQAKEQSLIVHAMGSAECDIGIQEDVVQCIEAYSPDLIINAAAYTAVDQAETDSISAYRVNAEGVENLALAAKLNNIPLLHISTDYVFDGEKQGQYIETDLPHPQSVYGASKLVGEQLLKKHLTQYIILRTSWVFAKKGNNFVSTMLKLGAQRDKLSIVNDQIGRPTFAGDIASILLQISQRYFSGSPISWGTYHFAGSPFCSWYQFAEEIFTQAKIMGVLETPPELNGIPSSDYPLPAKRPFNSVMSLDKLSKQMKFSNNWQNRLKGVIKARQNSQF